MTQAVSETDSQSYPREAPGGFKVWRPGTVTYRDALSVQDDLVRRRHTWPFDLLILLEHPTVITLGRSTDRSNLLRTETELSRAGIECIESRRGGDITLHGPGQLVGYPIVDLNYYQRDLHRFLRQIESVLIATLADFSLKGMIIPGKTGVWVNDRKIASLGIAVQRWISYHGFALNINNELSDFESIVPCGLDNIAVTSVEQELGRTIPIPDVTETVVHHFSNIMQRPFLGEFDGETATPQT